jgi:hypothetical protein
MNGVTGEALNAVFRRSWVGGLGGAVSPGVFHDFKAAKGVIRRYAPFADRNGLNGH